MTCEKWYIQRSGKGYVLKNCQSGRYLAVETRNSTAEPICRKWPIQWEITQQGPDGSVYIKFIRPGKQSYFLGFSAGFSNFMLELTTTAGGDAFLDTKWRLERLSGDVGAETPKEDQSGRYGAMARDYQVTEENISETVDRKLLEKDKLIAEKDSQIGEIIGRLAARDKELTEGTNRLVTQHQELAQIRLELVEARSRLVETQDALRRAEEKLASREAQLLRIQEQLNEGEPGSSRARQKEMDEIRVRMQAFEQFMLSQVSRISYSEYPKSLHYE
ncbi:hypothetical protein FRC12_011963 [Ceratobasidium sp. 428]|nr:hypothetical protein FRC12_011963 [Ceratobasidium sp. 428]